MNCGSLRYLHLTRVGERQGEALSFLCGELSDELDVTIYGTDGTLTRLLFPEFTESYQENFANHHFDYSIQGGGYPYHHTFSDKQLLLRDYDELWERYLRQQHEPENAMRLAYTRLRWPTQLSPFARVQYTAYLLKHARETVLWQLTQKDSKGLDLLLCALEPSEEILHAACEQARREGDAEALALLLERQRKREGTGFDREFDL